MDIENRIIGNRYQVISRIGNGGMATVYKAQDNLLKRFVAIKVLKDEFTTDDEFIRRFNIEAQAAASLAHSNIVSIYDVGHEDNIYYIVMELIQGQTLKQIIDEDRVLPWKWSLNIAIQIASALEMAHKNNIVHRDIKPHNIIITEEGIAKVTDFGIAKAVSNSTITAFGTTIGSVHYFSPEHARGGFTDAKADIYSLGVVMYEMLTGKVPFDADTPVSVALKHMQEKPIEPIKLNPSIPYAVNKIILKAMEKDVNLRYQTATEMLNDLGLALKNPEGNFVRTTTSENAYTQVIKTLGENEVKNSRNNNQENMKKTSNMKKHLALKISLIIAILAGILVGGFFALKGILNIGRAKDINLPDFTQMTIEQAKIKAQELNIELRTEERYDKEIELGKIISQDPAYMENYKIKEGTVVQVVVSKGSNIKIVPKVVGKKLDEAEDLIEEAELVVEKIEEPSDKIQEGYITRQEPEAKTELNAGETVKIYVSTGIKQITMEYVIGEGEEAARKILEDIGFEVKVVYKEDTTEDNGVVLEQSLETGTTVNNKTKVVLTVNKIEEIKQGTVNIDLKTLTGGVIEKDENGNEINPTVNLSVKVGNDVVHEGTYRKDTENITVQVYGKGTITIRAIIDGVTGRPYQLNLNTESPVLNISE